MQVFEFHFNPRLRQGFGGQAKLPDLIFDSFCYEPDNIYERRLGSLYVVGILKNVLPKNLQFLEKLSKVIKERYYKSTIFAPEKSLKESLKEANEFLEGLAKKGDVSWLGNLSFAVLSFTPHQKPWWGVDLNFTKVGEVKIFLLRRGQIIDIDKKLRFQDIEPYPLKIFGNIVSGKLTEDDLILVQSKEVLDFFQKENLINEITKLIPFNERGLKEILDGKKKELSKTSGICLVIALTKKVQFGKKETISPQISKEFSLKEVFVPFFKFFKKTRLRLSFGKQVKKPQVKIPKIRFPVFEVEVFKRKIRSFALNKKLILILTLIVVLALGSIFSQFEEKQKIKIFGNNLKEIEKKFNLAEGYLVLENPQALQKANSLLKESWQDVSPILKEVSSLPKYFSNQVFTLRDEILKKLYSLNKLEEIKNPELFFEFKPEKFIPQKMLVFNNNLHFFSPYSKNLFALKENGENEIFEISQKINLATVFNESILLFSEPTQLTIYRGLSSVNLREPYPDFNFDDFSSFKGNLYFLDKKAGQIIKYPYLGNFEWGEPEFWLKKSIDGKPAPYRAEGSGAGSIAIDGSVWILEKDNSISRYYAGNFQEKIEIDIFPPSKDFLKILTSPSLPYLYILEPVQKRIVILNKKGEVIKQFQSEKFDNLLDFGISEDGKTIWLLNGLKVYKISFTLDKY